jgi:hypothetical protein
MDSFRHLYHYKLKGYSMFGLFTGKKQPRTMLDAAQEASGKLVVKGYRKIAGQHNCAPTAKTTDQKIVEIYQKIGSAFQQAAQQRGEHIPALYLNTIVLHYLQIYEMLGDHHLQNHLQYDVDKYLTEGLRDDFKRELPLFDHDSSDPEVRRLKEFYELAKAKLTDANLPEPTATETQSHNPLAQINQSALRQARNLITRDYGDLSDLPEEVRNTVVNVYYEFCCASLELKEKFPYPQIIRQAKDLRAGLKQFCEQEAFYVSAMNNLPKIINELRKISPDKEGYEFIIQVILDIFKYRIPDVNEKTPNQLNEERPAYKANIKEITDLWKLF